MSSKQTYDSQKTQSHPIFVKGLFEIDEHLPFSDNNTYGFRVASSGITGSGYLNKSESDMSVDLMAKTRADSLPSIDHIYFLTGRLLALNQIATPVIQFLHDYQIRVCKTSDFLASSEHNAVFTAFGIVIKQTMVTEVRNDGKQTVLATLQHHDYDAQNQCMRSFTAEYFCRPVPYLLKAQGLFQTGREIVVEAHLLGFNVERKTFVFNVVSISLSSGAIAQMTIKDLMGTPVREGKGKRLRLEDKLNKDTNGSQEAQPEREAKEEGVIVEDVRDTSVRRGKGAVLSHDEKTQTGSGLALPGRQRAHHPSSRQ